MEYDRREQARMVADRVAERAARERRCVARKHKHRQLQLTAAQLAERAAYRAARAREQEIAEAREWARFQVFAAESMRKLEARERLKAEVAAALQAIETGDLISA
jgi:hypothetical protein